MADLASEPSETQHFNEVPGFPGQSNQLSGARSPSGPDRVCSRLKKTKKIAPILRGIGVTLAILAVTVYFAYLVVYVLYAVNLFQWPFDYDQGEGFELNDAILYSQGEWPYRDNAIYPYYASNYPPLFHLLMILVLPIFGPSLITGRIVSFFATLITAGTISFVVRRKVGGLLVPIVSGLAFLASNYVYQIGPLARMHITMVMFEMLAIALIAEFDHPHHGRRNLVLGLIMLGCAGYTKQMAIFTVVAALGYIFLRDIRKSLIAGGALAVVVGIIFWLINTATGGQWWINVIQANVNEFDYRQTLFLFSQWFQLHTLFVLLAAGYLVYELFWSRLSAYSIWFVFSLGSAALSGKWGAGFGYFTTAIAAACLVSGLAVGKLVQSAAHMGILAPANQDQPPAGNSKVRDWVPLALSIIIPALYLIQAPRMLHMPTSGPVFGPLARIVGVDNQLIQGDCTTFEYHDSMGYTQLGHLMAPEDYAAGEEILNYVRTSDGPVFSEEAMFSILTDRPVVTNPTQLLNLHKNGMLNTTDMVRRISNEEFGLVVFRAQFYPSTVLEAIGQHYVPVEHICMNGFYYHILWPNRMLNDTSATPE